MRHAGSKSRRLLLMILCWVASLPVFTLAMPPLKVQAPPATSPVPYATQTSEPEFKLRVQENVVVRVVVRDSKGRPVGGLRKDLLGPLPSAALKKVTTVVLFARNQFQDSPKAFWLPKEVAVKAGLGELVFSNRHRYSDYQLFRVESVIRTDETTAQRR